MKKVLLITVLMGSLLIGACQNKEKPEVTTGESITSVEESSSVIEESTAVESNTEDSGSAEVQGTVKEEEKKANGVVEDATMNSVIIKMEDGSVLELSKTDETEIVSSKGLTIDDKVEVIYEGDTVKKIIVLE